MNCFEWQSRASDFLDGTLMGPAKRDAEEHLESCQDCNERYKHYRLILTSISSQPRTSLPIPIRKAPLSFALPKRQDLRSSDSKTFWRRLPWYARTSIEGASIVFAVLLAISAGPRVRALYDRHIEKNVTEFNETFGDGALDWTAETEKSDMPLSRAGESDGNRPGASEGDFVDDNAASAESESPTEEEEDDSVRAASSEVWRFNLKTDSPREFRARIVQLLTDLKLPKATPGLGGTEAPGGIQFDLYVQPTVVPSIKKQLEKMAPPAPEGLADTPMGETFAWYKNKSRRRLPDGKARVVIWLSQM